MNGSKPILSISNLSMHFEGIVALDSVNMEVQKQSITALIGPNGAGKTTLFNCLTGFYQPTKGDCIFHLDRDFHINQLYFKIFGGTHWLAKAGVARTFQNVRLFKEMTVIENCLIAQHIFSHRNLLEGLFNSKRFKKWEQTAILQASNWLERFHLLEDANKIAKTLPYGKQRYLEIARAMCTSPKLLCLDEPAAGLNNHETHALAQLILSLRSENNVSILIVEHDMSLIMKISDHIVVLDQGKVIASDNPLAIRQNKKVIEAYLGSDYE